MSDRTCEVCGREAQDGWKLCPGCGSKLPRASETSPEAKAAKHWTAAHPVPGERISVPGTLTIAGRIGALLGFALALNLGFFFAYAASAAPITEYGMAIFLAFAGLTYLVICALLGLAAGLSNFFPAFGATFCTVGAAAAVVGLVISVKKWNGAGAATFGAWLVEFALCYLILRGISPPMIRLRRRRTKEVREAVPSGAANRGLSHYLFGAILDRPDL